MQQNYSSHILAKPFESVTALQFLHCRHLFFKIGVMTPTFRFFGTQLLPRVTLNMCTKCTITKFERSLKIWAVMLPGHVNFVWFKFKVYLKYEIGNTVNSFNFQKNPHTLTLNILQMHQQSLFQHLFDMFQRNFILNSILISFAINETLKFNYIIIQIL